MKLIQKFSVVGLICCLLSCGPTDDVSTVAPSGGKINRSQLTTNVNSIAGSWTIYSIVSSRTDTEFQRFRDQIFNHRDGHVVDVRIHLRVIDRGPRGGSSRTMVSTDLRDGSCQVQFSFDHIYCCEQMLRVTLESNAQALQEIPMGCSSRAFGMNPQTLKEIITAGLVGSPTSRMPNIYHFTPIDPIVTDWDGRSADRRWVLLQNPAPAFTGQPIPDLETRIALVED